MGRTSVTRALRSCLFALIALPVTVAWSADELISLSLPDEFVQRTFTVTRRSGETVPRLLTIETFDPARGAFVFGDVTGAPITIPASEIRSIVFLQALAQAPPQVQMPMRQVIMLIKEARTLTIPARDLTIRQGTLTVKGDGQGLAREPDERWEPFTVTYDPARSAFTVEVQRVQYIAEALGGGGPSGQRKGLP